MEPRPPVQPFPYAFGNNNQQQGARPTTGGHQAYSSAPYPYPNNNTSSTASNQGYAGPYQPVQSYPTMAANPQMILGPDGRPINQNKWKQWIFGCFTNIMPTCCSVVWCWPCLTARLYDQFVQRGKYMTVLAILLGLGIIQYIFGIIAGTYNHNVYDYSPYKPNMVVPVGGGGTATGTMTQHEKTMYSTFSTLNNVFYTFLVFAFLFYAMRIRRAMRMRYSLEGSEISDCCFAYFCSGCVLGQMYMQVKDTNGFCDRPDVDGLKPVPDSEVMNV